jgi:hypothetical protein
MTRKVACTALGILSLCVLLVTLSPAAHAQSGKTGCSLSTLKGNYSVQGQGTILVQLPGFPPPPLPFGEIAIDFIDGAGNISGNFTANLDGVVLSGTVAGTYTVNPNCTGTINLVTSLGNPVNESFVVLRNGGLRLVDTDSYIVITRTMEKMRD